MSARFEVVRTAHEQWHARFIAANGRIVFVTENYRRKVGAINAIQSILFTCSDGSYGPIRYIDDRLKPMPRPELPAVGAS